MDKVLVQENVHTLLNNHFISIKINLDSEKQLARKYRVVGIPALLFLDGQGRVLKRINGYVPVDSLIATMKALN